LIWLIVASLLIEPIFTFSTKSLPALASSNGMALLRHNVQEDFGSLGDSPQFPDAPTRSLLLEVKEICQEIFLIEDLVSIIF
jgi:hypothetical protein